MTARTSVPKAPVRKSSLALRAGLIAGLALALLFGLSRGAAAQALLDDLSIEELADLRITSVSRQPERLAQAPASVFVITAEDIRRAGARSLPDALRLAPNLQVARLTAAQYSISARGFNNNGGNKLSVLVDGRSIYSPLFSGVFWDIQDIPLEDLERIEVISGPGGTLWGVNAVNGVINIITRAASLSQGTLLSAGADADGSDMTLRHGGRWGPELSDEQGTLLGGAASYRVFARYADRQATEGAHGQPVDDAGWMKRLGFRVDGPGLVEAAWTVSGQVYEGRRGQPAPGALTLPNNIAPREDLKLSGGHLQGRWRHQLGADALLDVQAYYDRNYREAPGVLSDHTETFDLQAQHAWSPAQGHALVWGGEYRRVRSLFSSSDFVQFIPGRVTQETKALFAQDTVTLSDTLALTLGTRLEHNAYTGLEVLPNARLAWTPSPDHLLWGAVSRTARAPARADRDMRIVSPEFVLTGGDNFQSEVARVYELGYRGQPTRSVSWSITAYHTRYDRLRTYESDLSGPFPVVYLANEMDGHTTGLEFWARWQATERWRLMAGGSVLDKRLTLKPGSAGLNGGPAVEGNDPSASWSIRSVFNPSPRWEFDAALRHVARLPDPLVPAYTVADVRLGLRPRPGLEFSLGAQNLFQGRHPELGQPAFRSEFGPLIFVRAVARF